jgi:hypothetical protein
MKISKAIIAVAVIGTMLSACDKQSEQRKNRKY